MKRLTALALIAILASATLAQADTVKGTAKPSGSKVFAWIQDDTGPVAVTAALKTKRATGMAVFDASAEFLCFSVGGFTDRLLRCTFDAIGGEIYAVLLVTASGKNKFDLTVQSGSGEFVVREAAPQQVDATEIVERMLKRLDR